MKQSSSSGSYETSKKSYKKNIIPTVDESIFEGYDVASVLSNTINNSDGNSKKVLSGLEAVDYANDSSSKIVNDKPLHEQLNSNLNFELKRQDINNIKSNLTISKKSDNGIDIPITETKMLDNVDIVNNNLSKKTSQIQSVGNSGRRCEHCGGALINDPVRGELICKECFTVVQNNIVSDITFNQSSSGVVSQAGIYIKRKGFNSSNFDQQVDQMEKSLREVADKVGGNISETIIGIAKRMYLLAYRAGFVRGRRRDHLAAALLYIALRSQPKEKSDHLLIDFADAVGLSIPALRKIVVAYANEFKVAMPVADPSAYMYRFMLALQLEGKELQDKVMKTGLKLLSRSMSDNLHLGRRPTGLVAAALFVACRICGHPRPKRDFVDLMFIHEGTLNKRLEELANLPVASMTVNEFESQSKEELEGKFKEGLPPSLSASLDSLSKNSTALKLAKAKNSVQTLQQNLSNNQTSTITDRDRFEQDVAFRSAEEQYDMVTMGNQPVLNYIIGKDDGSNSIDKSTISTMDTVLTTKINDDIVNKKALDMADIALKYLYSEAQQKTVERTWDLQYKEAYDNQRAKQQVNESGKFPRKEPGELRKAKLGQRIKNDVSNAVREYKMGTSAASLLGENSTANIVLQDLQTSTMPALVKSNLTQRMFSYGGIPTAKQPQTSNNNTNDLALALSEQLQKQTQLEQKQTKEVVEEEEEEEYNEYEYNFENTNAFMYN